MRKSVLFIFTITMLFVITVTAQKDDQAKLKPLAIDGKTFLAPPKIIRNLLMNNTYISDSRKFTGIPSIAVSNEGRFWAVWYAGKTPGEDANNYIVLSTSDDKGNTWEENLIIDPDGEGPVRAFDPEVWIDPEGKLWVFWTQAFGHDGTIAGVWAITTNKSNIKNPDWSDPRRLTDGVMMCKPLVLSSGEWILPVSTWQQTDNSAKTIMSTDKGSTWYERGAVNVPKEFRNADEHMIVEKRDKSLWMLVRTTYGIGESTSIDKGKSWSLLIPSKIKHTTSRFFIRRLSSGNLLLVKHGPIEKRIDRSNLMAFISKDDGLSWSNGLLLDERKGVSYPDGQQTKDGNIYIIYDYHRTTDQLIIMTSFTEEDILNSKNDSKDVKVFNQRKIISDGGEADKK